jgi:hypothetical protein
VLCCPTGLHTPLLTPWHHLVVLSVSTHTGLAEAVGHLHQGAGPPPAAAARRAGPVWAQQPPPPATQPTRTGAGIAVDLRKALPARVPIILLWVCHWLQATIRTACRMLMALAVDRASSQGLYTLALTDNSTGCAAWDRLEFTHSLPAWYDTHVSIFLLTTATHYFAALGLLLPDRYSPPSPTIPTHTSLGAMASTSGSTTRCLRPMRWCRVCFQTRGVQRDVQAGLDARVDSSTPTGRASDEQAARARGCRGSSPAILEASGPAVGARRSRTRARARAPDRRYVLELPRSSLTGWQKQHIICSWRPGRAMCCMRGSIDNRPVVRQCGTSGTSSSQHTHDFV